MFSAEPPPQNEIESAPANQSFENIGGNPYKPSKSLNLMTPEEFSTSPAKKDVEEFNSKEDASEINVSFLQQFKKFFFF